MLIKLEPDEITLWFIAFYRTCATEWLGNIIPGKYKHVNCFGWSQRCQVWVFYEVALGETRIRVAPAGTEGDKALAAWTMDADIIQLAKQVSDNKLKFYERLGFWCVPAVKHLVGIPGGALRPDKLWRDCLKANAKVICQVTPQNARRPEASTA